MLPSLVRIFNSVQSIQFSKPALNIIHKELQGIKKIKKNEETINLDPINIKKEIKIENLTFSYPDSTSLIFDDINLSILKGKLTGIYGASGSGKSTFVDLILGLIEPHNGKILVDGKSINHLIKKLAKDCKLCSQNVFLTDDTIKKILLLEYRKKILMMKRF